MDLVLRQRNERRKEVQKEKEKEKVKNKKEIKKLKKNNMQMKRTEERKEKPKTDKWLTSIKSDDIKIFGQNAKRMKGDDNYRSVYGSVVVSDGIYRWKMKIVKTENSFLYFGLAEDNRQRMNEKRNGFGAKSFVYFAFSGQMNDFDNGFSGVPTSECGRALVVDDIFEIILDLNAKQIRFIINGKDEGFAVNQIKNRNGNVGYCLLVVLCYKGDEVALL